jgi:hypothetical protein
MRDLDDERDALLSALDSDPSIPLEQLEGSLPLSDVSLPPKPPLNAGSNSHKTPPRTSSSSSSSSFLPTHLASRPPIPRPEDASPLPPLTPNEQARLEAVVDSVLPVIVDVEQSPTKPIPAASSAVRGERGRGAGGEGGEAMGDLLARVGEAQRLSESFRCEICTCIKSSSSSSQEAIPLPSSPLPPWSTLSASLSQESSSSEQRNQSNPLLVSPLSSCHTPEFPLLSQAKDEESHRGRQLPASAATPAQATHPHNPQPSFRTPPPLLPTLLRVLSSVIRG